MLKEKREEFELGLKLISISIGMAIFIFALVILLAYVFKLGSDTQVLIWIIGILQAIILTLLGIFLEYVYELWKTLQKLEKMMRYFSIEKINIKEQIKEQEKASE